MIASGGRIDALIERLARRRRGVDGVAGAAELELQRAQDLRLVVDDEDARAAHASTSAGSATAGSARTNVAPPPGAASTQRRPPLRSTKPRAIASPSPEPRSPSSRARADERLEDALALASRDSRAAVGDANDDLVVRRRRTQLDSRVGRRELERVLEHVDERALDLRRVDLDGGGVRAVGRRRRARSPSSITSSARATSPSTVHSSRVGVAAPASSRDSSSRFATSRSSRWTCARIDATSSSRSVLGERLAQLASTSLAVMIAVIGERRSWLTERRTAVFTASLRRSASASTASRWRRASLARASRASRSRSSAVARSDARIALTRAVTSGSTRSVESRNSRPTTRSLAAKLDPGFTEVGCSARIELDPAMRCAK